MSNSLASREDGTFDRELLFGTTAPQYLGWLVGTVLGAYGGELLATLEKLPFNPPEACRIV